MPQIIIFEVKPRRGRSGFDLSCDPLLPQRMWYARLYDAVIYAMRAGRDHRCEIRIYDHQGECLETVQVHPRRCEEESLAALLPD